MKHITFPTRKAALAWVRDEIKDFYAPGETVSDPFHKAVLFDLLERDSDEEKIGVGVLDFFVEMTSRGQGQLRHVYADARGIWIRRFDGTEDDWSYVSAINADGLKSDVKEALRATIDDLRVAFREEQFRKGEVYCFRTGNRIPSFRDAEVRYVSPSWAELTKNFVDFQGGWASVPLKTGTEQIAGDLLDQTQRQNWREYWLTHARPVLTSKPK